MFGLVADPQYIEPAPLQTTTTSSGFLPTLQNVLTEIVKVAAPVGVSYLQYKTVKEQVSTAEQLALQQIALEQQRLAAIQAAQQQISPAATPTRYPVYGATVGEADLGSMLPILGIIGIGLFLVLRGRKSKGRK